MSSLLPISIVIPFLNEEDTIIDIFNGINSLTKLPTELIFVDAGSIDSTVVKINKWISENNFSFKVSIVRKDNALPGAARNFGVKSANQEWIAFLDSGIRPCSTWLESLYNSTVTDNSKAAWGVCRYEGSNRLSQLVNAYSFGNRSLIHYFLAGSLFHKSIFNKIGFFREDLRAAEDTIWRNDFFSFYGRPECILDAEVSYTRFPTSLISVLKKWNLYAFHTTLSKTMQLQQLLYISFFVTLIISIFVCSKISLLMLLLYFFARGILDPVRRSFNKIWWNKNIELIFIGPIFVLLLDFSKFIGFIRGKFSLMLK